MSPAGLTRARALVAAGSFFALSVVLGLLDVSLTVAGIAFLVALAFLLIATRQTVLGDARPRGDDQPPA